jgi:trigger factor
MNITQEATGELTAVVRIELNKDDYQPQVENVLKDYRRKASMPGFRPGKVPMGMIKKMYSHAVLAEEVNKIISEKLHEHITENNLKILGHPLPNEDRQETIDFDKQEQLDFYFDIALQPEFEVDISDKVKMDYFRIKADDATIDKYISDLREKNGKPVNPDTSTEGDLLHGKLAELDPEGKPKEGGIEHETTLKADIIQSKSIKKQLNDLSVGDKIVFNLLEAAGSAEAAASILGTNEALAEEITGNFEFAVQSITRFEAAEMNAEFYTAVFPYEEIGDEKAFRTRLARELEKSFEQESDRLFMRQAAEILIDKTGFGLPDDFMKRWLIESEEANINPEEIDSQYAGYSRALRWQLIESRIVADHKLEVTRDDIREKIMGYFNVGPDADPETRKRLDELAENMMKNQEEVKRIYDQLLDTRMRDLLKSTLKLKIKDVDYDEFIKLASETK